MERRSGWTTKARSNQPTARPRRRCSAGAIGAALGAIIGAIAGGGKGAGIGAVIGAGGGAGTVIVEGRDQLDLQRGTEVTITSGAAAAPGDRPMTRAQVAWR